MDVSKEIRDLVVSVRSSIERIDFLLSGTAGGASANSLTDPLTPDGVWEPAWLDEINATYRAKHPDGWIYGPTFDAGGAPASRSPLILADGFWYDRCLARTDLTDFQRGEIEGRSQMAWGVSWTSQRDEVTGLSRLTMVLPTIERGRPGEWPLAVPQFAYKTDDELRRATVRMYEIQVALGRL